MKTKEEMREERHQYYLDNKHKYVEDYKKTNDKSNPDTERHAYVR